MRRHGVEGIPIMLKRQMRRLSRALFFLEHRTWFVALFEIALVFSALVLAWAVVKGARYPEPTFWYLLVPLFVIIRLAFLAKFNLFHGWWRYAGINEVLEIIKAVFVGSLSFLVLLKLIGHFRHDVAVLPLSLWVVEGLLTTALLAGVRLLSRLVAESVRENVSSRTQVGIIGAGFAAQMIIREINRPHSHYTAIVCFDDDRAKIGIRLHGVSVVGTVDEVPALAARCGIDEILIAVPSATGQQMTRFVEICQQAGLKFKTVPRLHDMISGNATINQIRDVNLEDLLVRQPVRGDLAQVRSQIEGRVVIVTGAAGSIGSELCHQIIKYGPRRLLCVDSSENGIFYLQLALSSQANGTAVTYHVADVGDSDRMAALFSRDQVDIVFHAAAHKHVPIMEMNVQEAVANNVFGLMTLLDTADRFGGRSFVLISSDKAVNPSSVMGCTKRICELIISSRPKNGMRCVSVRFGNVLGSNGSVVPVFQDQLRAGNELTVTHPDIKRFFMTTREAVFLVLEAFAIGEHGDVLVLDMGEPLRIIELAKRLIRLSGKSEDEVHIRITGLREGEKMREELFYHTEQVLPTSCDKIKRARSHLQSWDQLKRQLNELRLSMYVNGPGPVRAKMREIVPEYVGAEPKAGFPPPPAVTTAKCDLNRHYAGGS